MQASTTPRSNNAAIFLSGRLISLVVLVGFQILLVRALVPGQYALYALVFGIFALLQNAVSFGIPRMIGQFLPRAGWRITNGAGRKLVLGLLALRLTGSILALLFGVAIAYGFGLIPKPPVALLVAGGIYVLVAIMQIDMDAMAQALQLQRISRMAMVGEAVARFALVLAAAAAGSLHTAVHVLTITVGTALLASGVLAWAIRQRLHQPDHDSATERLDRAALRATALGGYASSMAWFATSPPIIRLIGGYFLTIPAFAGFAFAQSLVLSIQRYTPASLLLPFLEPTVIRDFARTGDQSRLESALSLLIKIDALVIGAGVVAMAVGGVPIVDWVTAGKYGPFAYAIPWLLVYIASNSIYRSFEIAALTLGAGRALLRTLMFSGFWPFLAIALTWKFGLIALLACPVADALGRLAIVHRLLHRAGVRRVIDLPMVLTLAVVIAGFALGGFGVAHMVGDAPVDVLVIAVVTTGLFIVTSLCIRPFRQEEIVHFTGDGNGRTARLLKSLSRR